jgi:hypothetical protein
MAQGNRLKKDIANGRSFHRPRNHFTSGHIRGEWMWFPTATGPFGKR